MAENKETLERPQTIYRIECPRCEGTGKQNRFFRCPPCRGTGRILAEK